MDTYPNGHISRTPVLHVVSSNQHRGAELVAWSLVQRLDGDHELVALAPEGLRPSLDVLTLGRTPLSGATLTRLRRRMSRASAVVAHGSRTLPACVLALAGRSTPLIYVNIGDPRYWSQTVARRLRLRMLYRRVDRVALLTGSAGAVFERDFAVPANRLRMIGSGRPLASFPPTNAANRAEARRSLGIEPHRRVVAFLGAMSPEKRIDVLIDAVAQLPDVDLLVAGDGPLRRTLEASATRLLGNRARFVGGRDDPLTILHAADVLGLTSETEGLPGVCIEAGLAGIPVVATNVGFVSDIVQHGITGLLVPTGDPTATAHALQVALEDADRLGGAARRHCAARFDFDEVVARWQSLLAEVTDSDGSSLFGDDRAAP